MAISMFWHLVFKPWNAFFNVMYFFPKYLIVWSVDIYLLNFYIWLHLAAMILKLLLENELCVKFALHIPVELHLLAKMVANWMLGTVYENSSSIACVSENDCDVPLKAGLILLLTTELESESWATHKLDGIRVIRIRTFPFLIKTPSTALSLTIWWKLTCRSRKQKQQNQRITKHGIEYCDWFILPFLLPNPTI